MILKLGWRRTSKCRIDLRFLSIMFIKKKKIIFAFAFFSSTVFSQHLDGGNGHAIILKDGKVWTVGRNNYGQLGDSSLNNSNIPIQVKGLKNVIAVSRGYDHSIALKDDGTAWL